MADVASATDDATVANLESLRVTYYTASTSPDTGTITRRCFGIATVESTCPWGSDSFSLIQRRLSSQADNARLLNVFIYILCCFERMSVICTRFFLIGLCIDIVLFLTRCLEMTASLILHGVSLYFILYILRRRIISRVRLAVSSLNQSNLALFTVLYVG